MGRGWKYTLSGRGCSPPPPSKHPKSLWKTQKKIFCFSDKSYRNRKSHKILGHLEAIWRVLELIFGRGGVEHPPVPNRVKFWIVVNDVKWLPDTKQTFFSYWIVSRSPVNDFPSHIELFVLIFELPNVTAKSGAFIWIRTVIDNMWYIIWIVSSSPNDFHLEKIGLIRVTNYLSCQY